MSAPNVIMLEDTPKAIELLEALREQLHHFERIMVRTTEAFEWCMERGFDQVRFVGGAPMAGRA